MVALRMKIGAAVRFTGRSPGGVGITGAASGGTLGAVDDALEQAPMTTASNDTMTNRMSGARSTERGAGSRFAMDAQLVRVRVSASAVAALLVGLSASTARAADDVSVTVRNQRVQVEAEGRTLTVEATVENGLEVPLTSVDVGWLLADAPARLEAIADPASLYLDKDDPKHAEPPPGVVVVRDAVEVLVPAKGRAVARLTTQVAADAPAVYRTHVLGYVLADASAELALRLIRGTSASDERAAVDFAGIAGADKARARRALRSAGWLPALTRVVSTPATPPTPAILHDRIFAIRALGIVGGSEALDVLVPLRDCADMAAFDELLRFMLIDRLRGNRLETPLAFAIPTTARKMSDLFDAAINDAKSDFADAPPSPRTQVPPGSPAALSQSTPLPPGSSTALSPGTPSPPGMPPSTGALTLPGEDVRANPPAARPLGMRVVGWTACAIAFIVSYLALRRRK